MVIADDRPLEIKESASAFVVRLLAPAALALVAAAGFSQTVGFALVPTVFAVLAVLAAGVVLFDQPTRVVFDADGVHRHCLVRTQTIDWDSVSALERPPAPPRRTVSRLTAMFVGSEPRPRRARGLVVRVGRKRRYLLVNRPERPDQWEVLEARLKIWASHVPLPARPYE